MAFAVAAGIVVYGCNNTTIAIYSLGQKSDQINYIPTLERLNERIRRAKVPSLHTLEDIDARRVLWAARGRNKNVCMNGTNYHS